MTNTDMGTATGTITGEGRRLLIRSLAGGRVDPDTPCLEIDRCKNAGRYTQIWEKESGRVARGHRVAYCIAHGLSLSEINGMVVRHICHNPSCVSPLHLALGTAADNAADSIRDGRTGTGFNVPVSEMVDVMVPSILKERLADTGSIMGASREAIADYLRAPSDIVHLENRCDSRVAIRLPEEMLSALKDQAEGTTVTELVRTALVLAHGTDLKRVEQSTRRDRYRETLGRSSELTPKAIAMRKAGMTLGTIAAELGVSDRAIRRWTSGIEATTEAQLRLLDRRRQAFDLFAAGASRSQIAESFGVNITTVSAWLQAELS